MSEQLEALLWNSVKKQYKLRWQQILCAIPVKGISRAALNKECFAVMCAPKFRYALHLLLKHEFIYNKNGFIVINDAYRHVINKCIHAA